MLELTLQRKLLSALTGEENVREQALATCNTIQEWALQDNINVFVFDTTAVNTTKCNVNYHFYGYHEDIVFTK